MRKLVLVGSRGGTHVGECLFRAGISLGGPMDLLDANQAFVAHPWIRRFNWHFRGHRPTRLNVFSRSVVDHCKAVGADILLTTGLAPVKRVDLEMLRNAGVRCGNYLTDDPWNPTHRAPWFFDALPMYTHVFSPRHANLQELRRHGCEQVSFLPFAYDPALQFVDPAFATEGNPDSADVVFVGGADTDRIPYCEALIQAGLRLELYGGYWERFRSVREAFRGYADLQMARAITRSAKVSLCLVRKANRDDHTMRSYEVPAMGGCILAERTRHHMEMFGPEGEAALYFTTIAEMVEKAAQLLADPALRRRLAAAAHQKITGGANTYRDRLKVILEALDEK